MSETLDKELRALRIAELRPVIEAALNEAPANHIASYSQNVAERVVDWLATAKEPPMGSPDVVNTDEGVALRYPAGHYVVNHIAAYLAEAMREIGAVNYMALEVVHQSMGPMTMSIQRLLGKTPHEMRKDAEHERDVAVGVLNQIYADLRTMQGDRLESVAGNTYGEKIADMVRLAAAKQGITVKEPT